MMRLVEDIAQYLVFHDLSDEYLRLLARHADAVWYQAGDIIVRKGAPAAHFFLITDGVIELMEEESDTNTALPAHFLKAGEMVGWSWMVRPFRWNFFCKAIEDSELIRIDAESIRRRMDEDHELGYQLQRRFLPVVVKRLQTTRFHLLTQQGVGSDYY